MSSFSESRFEGFIGGLFVVLVPIIIFNDLRAKDLIDQHPEYYLSSQEMEVAKTKCSVHGGLKGVGALLLEGGRVRYEALCKGEKRVTWLK